MICTDILWSYSNYRSYLATLPNCKDTLEAVNRIIADLWVISNDFTGGHLEKIQMDVHVQLAEVCLFILFDVVGIDLSLSKSWPMFEYFLRGTTIGRNFSCRCTELQVCCKKHGMESLRPTVDTIFMSSFRSKNQWILIDPAFVWKVLPKNQNHKSGKIFKKIHLL